MLRTLALSDFCSGLQKRLDTILRLAVTIQKETCVLMIM